MGILADRLDRMVVRATSPDGNLSATLTDRTTFRLSFTPGSYRRYPEAALQSQLTRLAAAVLVAQRRGVFEAVSEAGGETVTKEPPAAGDRDRRYRAERDEIQAIGWSADRRIRVTKRGMLHWTVTLAAGTLTKLTEAEFTHQAASAVTALLVDHRAKLRALREKYFGDLSVL